MPSDANPRDQRPLLTEPPGAWALIGLIVLIAAGGSAMGFLFAPNDWYRDLLKPTWNPPAWLFGPVWSTLYAMMAIALWLILRDRSAAPKLRSQALWLFAAQYALNLAWTPLFFGLCSAGAAFLEICALWIVLLWTALTFGRIRPLAGYLLAPYLLWVSFALVLNGTIWLMNN